jgi:hypothetical protein
MDENYCVCIPVCESIVKHKGDAVRLKVVEIIISIAKENGEIWKIQNDVLTELSFLYFQFFQSYITHLIKEIVSKEE